MLFGHAGLKFIGFLIFCESLSEIESTEALKQCPELWLGFVAKTSDFGSSISDVFFK